MANSEQYDSKEHQHRRYNPLRGDWVLVSPHRLRRPWTGHVDETTAQTIPRFDPSNPLCPGNARASGKNWNAYRILEGESIISMALNRTYFNFFPCLNNLRFNMDTFLRPPPAKEDHPLFRSAGARGACKVMCFHPWSDLTVALMTREQIRKVVDEWCRVVEELKEYTWVQIWASSFLPNEPALKDEKQREYYQRYKSPLLVDYVKEEIERKERVVIESAYWLCVVPYWAVWPYETMLLPKTHVKRLQELDDNQRNDLSLMMKKLLTKYDNLFNCSFPYSMGWHGAPNTAGPHEHWQLHAVYLPPLLRSATVKKFMVGYEMLASPQRDLTAEQASQILRDLSDVHYTLRHDVVTATT